MWKIGHDFLLTFCIESCSGEIRHDDYTQALEGSVLGFAFLKLDRVMNSAVRKLPVFEVSLKSIRQNTFHLLNCGNLSIQWLTVLPQVVSRVMHKSTHVQALVHKILTHVLRSYPDQALWAMVSGVESSNAARSSRCTWVLNDAKVFLTFILIAFYWSFTQWCLYYRIYKPRSKTLRLIHKHLHESLINVVN